ncbi:MAG TPA: Verru/Chthon cassette protein A, partial [Candidatus Saccharimonadia bacterium]|nr:Verru/Chthon cassette protein A [Candidatus Saccharimonadia bacterium]
SGLLKSSGSDSILKFWEDHAITAENLKERPYTNLYPRLTTRSNTYQVHVRSQVIRKARSVGPEKFDGTKDSITAEYRGAVVLERYLDLNDPRLKSIDFATGAPGSKPSLDNYHRIRVLNQKRFDP